MDQESGNSRRRSSRLAAKGVVASPKPEVIKKTPKNTDKPKRQKRKQSEERPQPVAKKSKTDDPAVEENYSKKDNEVSNNVTESDQVDTVTLKTIPKKDKETPVESISTPDPDKVSTDKPDVASIGSKEQEKMDVDLPEGKENETETTRPELTKEVESTHSQKDQKIEEEKPVKISEVNTVENGLSVKEINDVHIENNDKESNGVVNNSSNGTTDSDSKQTNGAESIIKPDIGETKKTLCEGKNHISESETKNCNTILNISNNDIKEQDKTESNKATEKPVDNVPVSSEGIESNVDKPSTIVS